MDDDLDTSTILGYSRRGSPLRIDRRRLTGRSTLVLGQSGSGKSAFIHGVICDTLLHDPEVRVTLVDAKADTHAEHRDHILPALASADPSLVEGVGSVEPWSEWPAPFNLCAPIEGYTSDIQANLVVGAIAKFVDDDFGVRAGPIAIGAARAAIELRGNLLTMVNLLADQGYREGAASRLANPIARHFLTEVLPKERQDSIASVLARLRGMLALDRMRSIFSATTSVSGRDLVSARYVGIDASTAPLGEERLATGFGSWVFRLVGNAIMCRRPEEPPALVVVDEFQRLIESEEEFIRLLEQCRGRGAALWLVTQGIDSLPSRLRASILTNCRQIVALAPNAATIQALAEYLPRPSGRRVDPEQPDRVLSPAAERDAIAAEFATLGVRHGVYIDKDTRQAMVPFRTRSFPFKTVRARAAHADPELKTRLARGALGVPYAELLARAEDPVQATLSPGGLWSAPDARPQPADVPTDPTPARRKRRLETT